jgi:hypothetical protein
MTEALLRGVLATSETSTRQPRVDSASPRRCRLAHPMLRAPAAVKERAVSVQDVPLVLAVGLATSVVRTQEAGG